MIHDNKIAIVTGGNKGIGKAIVIELLKEGAIVINASNGINNELMKELNKEYPHKAFAIECDVSNEKQVAIVINNVVNKFGGLDYIVNNAGIDGPISSVDEYSSEEYKRVSDVNEMGVFYFTKYGLRHMNTNGSIVNIASVLGFEASGSNVGYVASKHAVSGITKSSALSCAAKGIRINSVAPGGILTDMVKDAAINIGQGNYEEGLKMIVGRNPMNRLGTPEEIANVTSFLLSSKASYITGQTIVVDGGQTIAFM